METTIAIVKDHAPTAVIVLLAVFFPNQQNEDLRREVSEGFTNVRAEISELGERMARIETKVENIDQRMIRFESILDGQRPPAIK